jgi:hypothetical protein
MLYFLYDTLHGRWSNHSSQPPSRVTWSFWPLYVDQRSLCMIYKPKNPTDARRHFVRRLHCQWNKTQRNGFRTQIQITTIYISNKDRQILDWNIVYTLWIVYPMRADFFGYAKALMTVWDHKDKVISTTRQYVRIAHKAACESQMLPAWNSPKGAQKDFILTPSQTTLM